MMTLEEIIANLLHPQKGILAADWSVSTATKKFEKYGIPLGEDVRRKYRQLLFETPGLEDYIGGVILHEETIRQKTDDGRSFPQLLNEKGIMPGIRLDIGQEEVPGFDGEQVSFGLDNIRKRLAEFKSLGAVFAKWRAAYFIGRGCPSRAAIEVNSVLQALYALFCLEAGILPVIEPDVVMDGDHSLADCRAATEIVLTILFSKLADYRIDRKKIILKPSMVLPGKESKQKVSPTAVAEATLAVFKKTVPVDVPGLVFLSGGQTLQEAAANLNEIVKLAGDSFWRITFSFARALQEPVLEVWQGKEENIALAQEKLIEVSRIASLARQGKLEQS